MLDAFELMIFYGQSYAFNAIRFYGFPFVNLDVCAS